MFPYDMKHAILRDEFEHRSVVVQIFQTIKGAKHCDLQHDYSVLKCNKCGVPIRPLICFLAFIKGHPLAEARTAERAAEMVRIQIDLAYDRRNGKHDEPEEPEDPDKTDEDDKPDEGEDPKSPTDLADEDDEDDPEDAPDMKKGGMTPQMEKMIKLGWPAMLKALARECKPKKPKNVKKPLPPKR